MYAFNFRLNIFHGSLCCVTLVCIYMFMNIFTYVMLYLTVDDFGQTTSKASKLHIEGIYIMLDMNNVWYECYNMGNIVCCSLSEIKNPRSIWSRISIFRTLRITTYAARTLLWSLVRQKKVVSVSCCNDLYFLYA